MKHLAEILEIEKDTWEMLVRREVSGISSAQTQLEDGAYVSFDLKA